MIISATGVRKARSVRYCAMCYARLDGGHIRLYGMAERGDPPYVIYSCVKCAGFGANSKETAKLKKAVAYLHPAADAGKEEK